MLTLISTSILLKFLLFLICYVLILKFKKMVLVDGFWALSFLPEFLVAFYFKGFTHGNVILFFMVLLWALRLSFYLILRSKNWKEDTRYVSYSKTWGPGSLNFLIFKKIILVQFFVSVLMSTCLYIYLFSPSPGWSQPLWNVPLLILFLIGLFLESTADFSLSYFKKSNSSSTYTGSVWRWIKYPNYFGEILIWLSFGLLALPFTYGVFALTSPLLIFYVLTFISGIPYLEKNRSQKKAEPYKRPRYNYIPGIF